MNNLTLRLLCWWHNVCFQCGASLIRKCGPYGCWWECSKCIYYKQLTRAAKVKRVQDEVKRRVIGVR